MIKTIIAVIVILFGIFLPAQALAHVVVRPNQLGVGERSNFVVSVPTEENNPTVGVRLVIPEGLQSVRPNVKPGWRIELKKEGSGEEAKITEIVWTGGNIPAEQRDEFVFSAQAPAEESTLVWKAYQTYSDGTIVAWDADPKTAEEHSAGSHDEANAPKPYSQTQVVNDLKADSSQQAESTQTNDQSKTANNGMMLSIMALALSATSLGMQLYKKKK